MAGPSSASGPSAARRIRPRARPDPPDAPHMKHMMVDAPPEHKIELFSCSFDAHRRRHHRPTATSTTSITTAHNTAAYTATAAATSLITSLTAAALTATVATSLTTIIPHAMSSAAIPAYSCGGVESLRL